MLTIDTMTIAAPIAKVFSIAAGVDRWPTILPHYRWVRFLEHGGDSGAIVEMAAWRPFGPVRYPTWWVSEMSIDRARWEIRYRHIRGITRGMQVVWRMTQCGMENDERGARNAERGTVEIEVVHEWVGPPWPVIGSAA